MLQRLPIMIGAAVVGVIFAAGLFIHGRVGGGLLLVTDAALIALANFTWRQLKPRDRAIRVVVIAAILVIAVIKLVGG